jgi:hypothetical protein
MLLLRELRRLQIFRILGRGSVLLQIRGCSPYKQPWVKLSLTFLLLSSVLVACSGLGGNTGSTGNTTSKGSVAPTATLAPVTLSALHWCDKTSMVFRDSAAATVQGTALPTPVAALGPANGTPTTITDWSVVKADLGFTVFLPLTLAPGSCLQSVSGILRNAIIGSNFIITYLLPNHDSITFSQTFSTKSTTFQCNPMTTTTSATGTAQSSTPTVTPTLTATDPVQLCSGVKNTTSIVFSAPGSTDSLQEIFQQLQPNVNWIPTA